MCPHCLASCIPGLRSPHGARFGHVFATNTQFTPPPFCSSASRSRRSSRPSHWCAHSHDRSFLLKFARDRTAYRQKLWEGLRQFQVALLNYCLTSNHVHVLIYAQTEEQISLLMQKVAGEFAQAYNRRKHRSGAFWQDRYHATMVDSGSYLFACLLYIALNMVRCGVVRHPREWAWSGYDELMGLRQRYRLVDLDKLLWLLGTDDAVAFRNNLEVALVEAIEKNEMARDPRWTESIAVGSKEYVGKMEGRIDGRQELEVSEERGVWVLKEEMLKMNFRRRKSNLKPFFDLQIDATD